MTNFAYTPRGELLAQWGATYPVKYDYDAAGRLWKLNTYRMNDPSSNPAAMWSAGDVTEWTYYPGRELLLQKKDAAGKGAVYEYDAAGRMSKRTWARPGAVATNYSYNLAGDMRLIHYSDTTTPDVAIAHDALGRVASIADGSGTRAFTYTLAGLPLNEDTATGRSLQFDYDAAGRKAGYALWEQGAFRTWGGWGYRPATGKMNGVSTREGWISDADAPATGGGTTRTRHPAGPARAGRSRCKTGKGVAGAFRHPLDARTLLRAPEARGHALPRPRPSAGRKPVYDGGGASRGGQRVFARAGQGVAEGLGGRFRGGGGEGLRSDR